MSLTAFLFHLHWWVIRFTLQTQLEKNSFVLVGLTRSYTRNIRSSLLFSSFFLFFNLIYLFNLSLYLFTYTFCFVNLSYLHSVFTLLYFLCFPQSSLSSVIHPVSVLHSGFTSLQSFCLHLVFTWLSSILQPYFTLL